MDPSCLRVETAPIYTQRASKNLKLQALNYRANGVKPANYSLLNFDQDKTCLLQHFAKVLLFHHVGALPISHHHSRRHLKTFCSGIAFDDPFAMLEYDCQKATLKMVLTLYKQDASAPVRTVNMVIEALGISDIEYVEMKVMKGDQFKEEFLKLNPQHTVPTLVDDDFVLWDSHAIATYLITVYGENDDLYPADPKQRARVDQRLHFDSGSLFPPLREAVHTVFVQGKKALNPGTLDNIANAYGFADNFVSESSWMAGDQITVADMSCVATITSLNIMAPIDESLYPNLCNWLERCSEQDFYKKGNEPGLSLLAAVLKAKME